LLFSVKLLEIGDLSTIYMDWCVEKKMQTNPQTFALRMFYSI